MMYRRTQSGTLMVTGLLCCITAVVVIGVSVGWNLVISIAIVILVAALILFRSLTIEVDTKELRCFFGDGLIRKRFLLTEIVSAEPVRNRWFYGWGIRLTPFGWMFNVSGLDAVELERSSGRRFRIGTDDPQGVVAAIRQFQTGSS